MSDRDFYPAGAYSDPNAPYNECEAPEIELDVTVREILVRDSTIVTNNAWYVIDEEGHRDLEDSNLDVYDEYEKQHQRLADVLAKVREEITNLRIEAEKRQRKLEEHYGVNRDTIPGVWLPEHRTEWYSRMCLQLIDAMKRKLYLKGLEAALDGWQSDDMEIER